MQEVKKKKPTKTLLTGKIRLDRNTLRVVSTTQKTVYLEESIQKT